jgi:hypothetical protein
MWRKRYVNMADEDILGWRRAPIEHGRQKSMILQDCGGVVL